MEWLWSFLLGKKCPHCGTRSLELRGSHWDFEFYYWCTWCFKVVRKGELE